MTTAADGLLFGTAGVPHSTPGTSTLLGIKQVAHAGLDCLEIEFVKGIKMGRDMAEEISREAQRLNISLSVHAPYSINLNSPEEGKRLVSQERILNSARLAALCGAKSLIFHPGYYGTSTSKESFETIKKGLQEVVSILKSERNPVILRPETMGKRTQFGTLKEILFLCREVDGTLPCIDFSHIHAREGKANSYLEFHRILRKISKKLGDKSLKNFHAHISGAEYSDKGEIKHLNLNESDFRYDEWIQALKDFNVSGKIISESPIQEKDAVLLKNLYHS
jgi:deoxyribonuclease-4